jgi:polyphosphate kinase
MNIGSMKKKNEFINREVSWLAFNDRVLNEAGNPRVPLIERMRFLGIFSNNLDEFFRVRVATLRRAMGISKKPIDPMDFDPEETLQEIQEIINTQQEKFDHYFHQVQELMVKANVFLTNEKHILKEHQPFLNEYYTEKIKPYLIPVILNHRIPFPQLNDASIYLICELNRKGHGQASTHALIEISPQLTRFVELPAIDGKKYVIFIDDLIRYFLKDLFSSMQFSKAEAWAIKTTRDAELDIDDDLSKGLIEKMSRSVTQRKKGEYVRLNYDNSIPHHVLDLVLKRAKIKNIENITPGGRYHNKRDLMQFPDLGRKDLCWPSQEAIRHEAFHHEKGLFHAIREKDILLHFPYHSFNYTVDLLRQAAIDPEVRTIRITLYRVSKNSQIVNALINAAKNGKRVTVLVELQARFDEEHNIKITRQLTEAGIRVIPGVQGLKVHCKLILISRRESNKTIRYVYAGTGNFSERTAKVYTDHALLTAHKEIGDEVRKLFEFFESNYIRSVNRHLIVSPFNTRRRLIDLINSEIEFAEKGQSAHITLKLNNLVDASLIRKLYEASQAGVKIHLIIRGICSLIPGLEGKSENIRVINIIGRYLEHSRVLVFGNGGSPLYFISSADWMVRNIDHRIETTIPIYDHDIQQQIQKTLDIQTNSNNERKGKVTEKSPLEVQELTYSFVQTLQSKPQHKKSKR